jgi:hypothetical protein
MEQELVIKEERSFVLEENIRIEGKRNSSEKSTL